MDCSNPVTEIGRQTVKEAIEGVRVRMRQDLAGLRGLAEGAKREIFSDMEPPFPREAGAEKRLRERFARVPEMSKSVGELEFLETIAEGAPVCSLTYRGVPLHKPGVNQSGGLVSVNRLFGSYRYSGRLVSHALRFFPEEQIAATLESAIYTDGSATGFVTRLRELVGGKGVQATDIAAKARGFGKSEPLSSVVQRLRKHMPLREDAVLPDWTQPLEKLIEGITTNTHASAGAPYWRSKAEAMRDIMDGVLPVLVDAINEGTLASLLDEQPELDLCECKNKLDRYEPAKLDDKCRPYFSMPAHWSFLFSVLSQGFQHALMLATDPGSRVELKGEVVMDCANAYGVSWAHGGGERLLDFVRSIRPGQTRFYCYGDDSDLYHRRRDGTLYRVSPDFRQMDSAVDAATVRAVLQYIIESFEGAHGRSDFFNAVTAKWYEMTMNPKFLVKGTKVYQKRQAEYGIPSGVVGTTLFDTAKSILAYSHFVEQHNFEEMFMDATKATAWFRDVAGLRVKEGTWEPSVVNELPLAGYLFSENKFLGMRMQWVSDASVTTLVPTLREEEWLKLILVTRDNPTPGTKRMGDTEWWRLMFDRARGYLVTGAWENDRISNLLYYLIDQTIPEVIIMNVQSGGGNGLPPQEAPSLCVEGKEFSFPNSDGVPTREWCKQLYTRHHKAEIDDDEWRYVFPEIRQDYLQNRMGILPALSKKIARMEVVGGEYDASFLGYIPYVASKWAGPEYRMEPSAPPAEPPKTLKPPVAAPLKIKKLPDRKLDEEHAVSHARLTKSQHLRSIVQGGAEPTYRVSAESAIPLHELDSAVAEAGLYRVKDYVYERPPVVSGPEQRRVAEQFEAFQEMVRGPVATQPAQVRAQTGAYSALRQGRPVVEKASAVTLASGAREILLGLPKRVHKPPDNPASGFSNYMNAIGGRISYEVLREGPPHDPMHIVTLVIHREGMSAPIATSASKAKRQAENDLKAALYENLVVGGVLVNDTPPPPNQGFPPALRAPPPGFDSDPYYWTYEYDVEDYEVNNVPGGLVQKEVKSEEQPELIRLILDISERLKRLENDKIKSEGSDSGCQSDSAKTAEAEAAEGRTKTRNGWNGDKV